jgi:putative endopeptidase
MNKKVLLLALSISATVAGAQNLSSGIDKANLDESVKPGNNFYQYAVGGWLKANPLDAEHPENGAFVDLDELNQKRIRTLVEEYANNPQQKGSLGQKIGSIYRLMMDSVRLNREGYEPLKPILAQVAAIKSKGEYQIVAAQLDRRGIGVPMFSVGVSADQRNSMKNLVNIYQGGIGLGERDYYLKDDAQTVKIRNTYKNCLKKLFMRVGDDEATAVKKVEAMMVIETRIAKASYSQVQLRDVDGNYHKMSYAALVTDFPGINWGDYFLSQGFPSFEEVSVCEPEPIHEVEKIMTEISLDDLKTYAEGHVLLGAVNSLDDSFRAIGFELSQAFSGVQQDRPRWKRSVSRVSDVLGEAIGKMYVEKYFPESSKTRMLEIVHALQEALAQRINEATWMSKQTKVQAVDKLKNFIIKIGYPDKWRDYSRLQIDDSLSLYENMRRASEFETQYVIDRKVNKPVDKSDWDMTPQTINAYYSPNSNEICFPAAILQPPFFDPSADDAANLGGIGAVIGHEMSHGFDDQGCQFDKEGNQHNWWTEADKKNFEKRTKVLEEFFSVVEAVPGKHINGKQTLGENIGDNGGLNVAFRALQNSMKKNPLGVKDGFIPEQRFFLSYARVWASNMSPEVIDYLITTDVHSPNFARVNAALPQIDAWYKAFNVKSGDKLFVPKAKRAHIW